MENKVKPNKTALILHGHFYQPPRENPYTGIIEKQPSAAPFTDWNENIFKSCYSANAYSRYLDEYSKVVSMTNNYSYISYNFGSTLLSWMYEYHKDIHDMIVQSDKDSIKRLGFGNAMAQGFNHTILPLDNKNDARLQIIWGLDDFEYRFGRKADGMWLPETAINSTVVDLLAEQGLKFVVLSPWQCKSVETKPGVMVDLQGRPAPYNQPYILTGENGGEIAAFFYHPNLASDISFGHALRDADKLYNDLVSIKNNDNCDLLHTATDGEIYGHHEPFGDMALAALIKKVEERDDFYFTNYAAYLNDHKPTLRAILHKGEEGKGTSWSCSHGVSRWYKDCGCHTGGENSWNQEWRTPLRNGLNHLAAKIDETFYAEVDKIFSSKLSGYNLLKKCGPLFSKQVNIDEFLTSLHKEFKFSKDNDVKLATLLSGMKNSYFSFTSCGWFFSDLSGLEPKQDMKYALYSIKMIEKYSKYDLLESFLQDIKHAKSNIKSNGDGMSIAIDALKGLPGEVEAALFFTLNRILTNKEDNISTYGRFSLVDIKAEAIEDKFHITVLDNDTLLTYHFSGIGSSNIDNGINFYYTLNDKDGVAIDRYRITNDDIPARMLDDAFTWNKNKIRNVPISSLSLLHENLKRFSILATPNQYTALDTLQIEYVGLAMKLFRAVFVVDRKDLSFEKREEILTTVVESLHKYGRHNENTAITTILSEEIEKISINVSKNGIDEDMAKEIISLMKITYKYGFKADSTPLQNAVYPYYSNEKQISVDSSLARDVYNQLNFR